MVVSSRPKKRLLLPQPQSRRMNVTVTYKKLPIAPRKLRAVLWSLKGHTVVQALALLAASPRATTTPIEKLLKAAVSAVKDRQPATRATEVKIVELFAGEGARLYRTRIRGKGRGSRYAKRGSHLTLTVQASELRSQTSDVKNPKSEIRNPKTAPKTKLPTSTSPTKSRAKKAKKA